MKEKVVILHGFAEEEILALRQAVKTALPSLDIIFAASTETSLQWKLADLVEHLGEEHQQFLEYLKKRKA